ncbi:MAG: class I SAM-dependent methyltransferase [Cyanobacteria bacterium P01_D01_bin.36]
MADTIPSSAELIKYWDANATSKAFSHPIPQEFIETYFPTNAKVLDVGCGQGRLASYLSEMNFQVSGTDTSTAMLEEARKNVPNCEFRECRSSELTYEDNTFDVAIAVTLLTSVPFDLEQRQIMSEIKRVLKPEGILFISDLPLQWSDKYLERYQKGQRRYGQYGVFDLEDGGVVRHHELSYFNQLVSSFTPLKMETHNVVTMNGNQAEAVRFVGKN